MTHLDRYLAAIAEGMRHVTLPDAPPNKIEIDRDGGRVRVRIEYAGTTVRHEFVPEKIDTCVCCGGYVPEGRQVCRKCEGACP